MINSDSVAAISMPTQIQYTLLARDSENDYRDFFHYAAFEYLRGFPKDLLQLQHAGYYYERSFHLGRNSGINLFMLNASTFTHSRKINISLYKDLSDIFNRDIIKVFIVDGTINNHKNIAQLIADSEFGYYMFINDPGEENFSFYNKHNIFENSQELIALIRRDLTVINLSLEKKYNIKIDEFDFKINKDSEELNPLYPTSYAYSNYFLLNQLLANDWDKRNMRPKSEDFFLSTDKRVILQLKQSQVIDSLANFIRTKEPASLIESIYPTMIIIAPFHFPKYRQVMSIPFEDEKLNKLFKLLQTEQEKDYTYNLDEDLINSFEKELIAQTLKIPAERLTMLDFAGYFHAQLSSSPIFRMPIVGRSINADLAGFENTTSFKRNALKRIEAIGEKMNVKMLAPELKDYLQKRNGQLVFISDLPMEWLKMSKYPIFLTHDVCRLPEFNFNSLMNNYIHNQRLNFEISNDILKRTLIIHCASENDQNMHYYFDRLEEMKEVLGFKSIRCNTVEAIKNEVRLFKPDFLIFDCHGNFDRKELSSYLVIDAENNVRLTGDQIIKYGISAPLVFISACSTMPSYGYTKLLSDAFMQAGAFSVTATFLPIRMQDASILMIRILNGLEQLEKNVIFSNWLAFISHTLRSTLVHETVNKMRDTYNLGDEIDNDKIAEILLRLMTFDTREEVFNELGEYLNGIVPEAKVLFDNLEHEWLCYTTLGRADLVRFKSWIEKHRENYEVQSSE